MGRYQVHRSDANAKTIREGLEARGVSVEPIGRPLDFLCGVKGQTYLLEIKTAKGKLEPSQEDFLMRWRGQAAVVRTLEEALKELGL